MSERSEENLRRFPTKPYDMIREGLFVLGGVAIVIILLCIFWGTPDYPTVTIQEVAQKQPIAFLERSISYLSGKSSFQTYGPPYTNNPENAQAVLGVISPQRWIGEINPVNAQTDFILTPLQRMALTNGKIAAALSAYEQASPGQQAAWDQSYSEALKKASVSGQNVVLPKGNYGPVEGMMNAMLQFGRAGILEGILDVNPQLPYDPVNTNSLLFLQGSILNNVAVHLDQQSNQWGMSHESGPYPGAWWMWPYTFLYQIPAIQNSPNADLIGGLIMFVVFLLLVFFPLIPGLNRLPHAIGFYRVIWHDWYNRADARGAGNDQPSSSQK